METKVENKIVYTEGENYPKEYKSHTVSDDYIEIESSEDLKLRIYPVTEHIVRLRYSVDGYFEADFSYALDEKFKPSKVTYVVDDRGSEFILKTSKLLCVINKQNLKVTFKTVDGKILCEEEKGFHWEKNKDYGGYIVQNSKVLLEGESFYGLGDKPTDLNLRKKKFTNWGTDEYGYHKDTDPLYKSIPIYYALNQNGAYGIFFDNTYRSHFDFGSERENVTSFWAQGGEMNYYFIAGPELMDVCRRYTELTGVPEMPPLWALGYQQCKWSYYPDKQVLAIASKMRELKIPCDAIYLDIDYMDGFRCFTWDKEKFPDPKGLVDNLKEQGFNTMVIIDPGIKIDKNYSVFQEGLEKGYFCKRIDGHNVEGKVWPGECYFPDFTRPEVREWWAGLYKGLIEEVGVAGVWNDMNEPALFEVESKTFPLDVLHGYEGNQTGHRKAHNIYGMQMARATAEGVKKFRNGQRTLIITRSGYSGLQRYSSVWTGDNIATFEHLWLADVQAQRLAISGISFCGSDIGGFINKPTPELMMRWIQLGIFHPFCRVHSSGDHGDQEPWSFGDECTNVFRKFVELRYQLLPYIYTTFYQYYAESTPMMRPLVFFDQHDIETKDRDHEFLCGDHILVCPVIKEEAITKNVYLPASQWYNYWTKEKLDGSMEHKVDAPLDQIPIFIKAGAIVPLYPVQQYVGEQHIDTVSLDVHYKDGQETSYFYDDDKNGYGYEKGEYQYSKFELMGSSDQLTITQTTQGKYDSEIKHFKLNLIGLPAEIVEIKVNDSIVASDALIPSTFEKITISWTM